MSSILSSHGVVLAAAMAVSGTVIYLAVRWEKNFPPTRFSRSQDSHPTKRILRSCLSSDGKRRERKTKKRVQFAESVKDVQTGNGEEYRKEKRRSNSEGICRAQFHGIPGNRVALYNVILKDRGRSAFADRRYV